MASGAREPSAGVPERGKGLQPRTAGPEAGFGPAPTTLHFPARVSLFKLSFQRLHGRATSTAFVPTGWA